MSPARLSTVRAVVCDAWQTDVLNGIVTTILASLMLVAYVLAWKWAS